MSVPSLWIGARLRAVSIAPFVLIGVTRCAEPADSPHPLSAREAAAIVQGCYYSTGALSGSLRDDRPVPLYSTDPQDAWNRLHALLFTRITRPPMCAYFHEGGAARLAAGFASAKGDQERLTALFESTFTHPHGDFSKAERRIGGDAPDFLLYHDVRFLLQEDTRLSALERLLAEADTKAFLRGRSTVARILMQQDLWDRFDELDLLMRYEEKDATIRARAGRLKALLGRAIARVACRTEDLSAVPSNLADIARRYAYIDPALFSADSPWRELVPFDSSSEASATAHAHTTGLRRLFRVFLRASPEAGGAECLEAYFRRYGEFDPFSPDLPCFPSSRLARGTRAMLVETLLALNRDGEIVSLPLIFSVQTRAIRPLAPGPDGRFALEDLPFFVLHGSRLLFVRAGGDGGGLEQLPADAPVPMNLSAFESSADSLLVPLRLACQRCHGPAGNQLMTTGFHGIKEVRVLHPGSTWRFEAVARAKQRREDYKSLRSYFAGP